MFITIKTTILVHWSASRITNLGVGGGLFKFILDEGVYQVNQLCLSIVCFR